MFSILSPFTTDLNSKTILNGLFADKVATVAATLELESVEISLDVNAVRALAVDSEAVTVEGSESFPSAIRSSQTRTVNPEKGTRLRVICEFDLIHFD